MLKQERLSPRDPAMDPNPSHPDRMVYRSRKAKQKKILRSSLGLKMKPFETENNNLEPKIEITPPKQRKRIIKGPALEDTGDSCEDDDTSNDCHSSSPYRVTLAVLQNHLTHLTKYNHTASNESEQAAVVPLAECSNAKNRNRKGNRRLATTSNSRSRNRNKSNNNNNNNNNNNKKKKKKKKKKSTLR
eukprot:Trichotokara_eunicae@DN2229_c0_g1_i1.p1